MPDPTDPITNLHNQSQHKNSSNQTFSNKLLKETMKEVAQSEEDKKDKESSSQDENHDPPAEVEQNKEQENLATSDVSTLIRTSKTPKSKYIEDRVNKVEGKTKQDALKTMVKDKNSLTILYIEERPEIRSRQVPNLDKGTLRQLRLIKQRHSQNTCLQRGNSTNNESGTLTYGSDSR